jgi:hypothetical protein
VVEPVAPYRSYVIRCWEERCWEEHCGPPGTPIYRFSLDIPATGERFGFTSSKDLIQAVESAIAQIQA